jgi:ADP-ribose pyrophosphatase YjhB (NUDIX family)
VDSPAPPAGRYKKLGAGLLVVAPSPASPRVLLLQRQSKHHDAAWGLPGGNAEKEDGGSLLATAKREGTEEMGGLPPGLTVLARVDVTRGKGAKGKDDADDDDDKKFYAVYVATADDAAAWTPPRLDAKESRDARWVPLAEAGGLDLHPVAAAVLREGGGERGAVDAALRAGGVAG